MNDALNFDRMRFGYCYFPGEPVCETTNYVGIMGVRGLMTVILKNRGSCAQSVDLVKEAEDKNGIEILVDYDCLLSYVNRKLNEQYFETHGNPFLKILGGEYRVLEQRITNFVSILEKMKIKLVLYDCVGRSNNEEDMREGRFGQKKRPGQQESVRNLLDSCEENWREANQVGPMDIAWACQICFKLQLKEALARHCEFVCLVSEKKNHVLARDLHDRQKAFAIWSGDSDLAVFEGSRFMPPECFDVDNELNFSGEMANLQTLRCDIIHADMVAKFLKVSTIHIAVDR